VQLGGLVDARIGGMTSRRAARRKARQQGTAGSTSKASCEVCGRKTRWLFGVCAGVNNAAQGTMSVKVAALGYCPDHRAEVLDQYRRELKPLGEVSFADGVVDLEPVEVEEFLAFANREIAEKAFEPTIDQPVYQPVDPADVKNAGCPQCGVRLSWGTGPHVDDARRRAHAVAWECLDCRSAGMLVPT
jgi:hypothetical protein